MSTQHIVDEVCRLFPAIFQCFYRRTKTQDYRPSLESLSVLQHLAAVGPMTVSEACVHFDRSQASMSELFARLEARGLLDRIQDPKDRRRSLLWTSEEGRRQLAQSSQILSPELLLPAIQKMTPTQRTQLIEGMSALVHAASKTHRGNQS